MVRILWISILALFLIGCKERSSSKPSESSAPSERNPDSAGARSRRNVGMAVSGLLKLLGDKNPKVRGQSVMALGNVGSDAESAVPGLIKALRDEDEDVRYWAIIALGKIGPGAKSAITALLDRLKDGNTSESAVVTALSQIGDAGVPAMTERLDDPNPRIRKCIARALGFAYVNEREKAKEKDSNK